MELGKKEIYLIDFEDERGKHIAVGKERAQNILVKKMDDPQRWYAETLEESPEESDGPKIAKLEFPSDFFEDPLDFEDVPVLRNFWAYEFIPFEVLYSGGNESESAE